MSIYVQESTGQSRVTPPTASSPTISAASLTPISKPNYPSWGNATSDYMSATLKPGWNMIRCTAAMIVNGSGSTGTCSYRLIKSDGTVICNGYCTRVGPTHAIGCSICYWIYSETTQTFNMMLQYQNAGYYMYAMDCNFKVINFNSVLLIGE